MALNDYEADRHHIGLKDSDMEDAAGFTIVGQYVKEIQRESLGGQDFGGSTDLIGYAASVSRVTQDDFTGGAYSQDWEKDAAMFADSLNFLSQPQSKALASVPPLVLKQAFDPSAETGGIANETPHSLFMVAGSIYACFHHGIMRYQIGTDTLTWSNLYYDPTPAQHLIHAEYDSNDQVIVTLWSVAGPSALGFVARVRTDLSEPAFNPAWFLPAATDGMTPRGMEVRDSLYVVAIDNHVWSGNPPDKTDSVDGVITWTEIGRLPGRWRASTPYAGLTYILCTDGAYKTFIMAYDGTSLLPIVTFPFSFEGKCIVEYAGRIYVGGVGTDVNGGQYYAELYEVTGASVRLVRSFAPDANRGDGNWPHIIQSLSVFEGLLWFHQQGRRLMTYDVTSDGIFGSSQYNGANSALFDVYKMTAGRGRLWCWAHDSDDSPSSVDGIYRIAQPGDTIEAYDAYVETADFTWEAGVKKRWDEIRVLTRYVAADVSYSVDGGDTWTALVATSESVQAGNLYVTAFGLGGITPTHFIRFRLTLPLPEQP